MKKTPARDIIAMVGRKEKGDTYREIAEKFGVHENTVIRLIQKARKCGVDTLLKKYNEARDRESTLVKDKTRFRDEAINLRRSRSRWKIGSAILFILLVIAVGAAIL